MIQAYYDEKNDRFILAPLRCGSSYTERFALSLNWIHIDEIYNEVAKKRESSNKETAFKVASSHSALRLLLIMADEKYKKSQWITVVRDPWARYVSAANMILGSNFYAPGYVHHEEVERVRESFGAFIMDRDTAYYETDRMMTISQSNSALFDFSLQDGHLVPVVTVQLLMFVACKNLEFVKLSNYTEWLKKNYPPGDDLQHDYYDIVATGRREKSDVPTKASISVYRRFLEPIAFYNDQKAKRFNIETTFSRFISYDYECWELIQEQPTREQALQLLMDLMDDPYFFARHKQLYQIFMAGPQLIDISAGEILRKSSQMIPDIHQFFIKNCWLNLENTELY